MFSKRASLAIPRNFNAVVQWRGQGEAEQASQANHYRYCVAFAIFRQKIAENRPPFDTFATKKPFLSIARHFL
jgi:hypothetical protein